MSRFSAQSRLYIDIDALRHNLNALRRYVGDAVDVMPVIKADGYGSGVSAIAKAYADCRRFAVADINEATQLRAIFPSADIIILYQPLMSEIPAIVESVGQNFIFAVGGIEFARALNDSAMEHAVPTIRVHVEVDTGMGRLGVQWDKCGEFALELARCKNLAIEGIFTHYSSADMYSDSDLVFTETQTQRFKTAIEIFERVLGRIPLKHACASSGIFNPKAEWFDMVRPGFILYGYEPCPEIREKIALKPALKFATYITQIKEFEANTPIGYARAAYTDRKTKIALVPVGYSDGVMRKMSNKGSFVVNGERARIIGNVCMDFCMLDVTDISANVGDEVFVFDNVNVTVDEIAALCETSAYEILTNMREKADRK